MRHYEILLLIHPDQSNQTTNMLDKYVKVVKDSGGTIHRQEDWGKVQLAYKINKLHKAHYFLFNIECEPKVVAELNNMLKFNDAVIRSLVTKCDMAITEQSAFLKNKEQEKSRDSQSNYSNVEKNVVTADTAVADSGANSAVNG